MVDEPFANEPIPVDDLPQLREESFVSVDPRYLRASLTAMAIGALIVAIVGSTVATQSEEPLITLGVAGGILLLICLRAVVRTIEVRRLGYQVRAHDLSIRSGVITHRTASLPFARVQHVRIHRGAIERALGLATLQVSSAGPNITIPGLADADAQRIKLLVTERAGMTDESDVPPIERPPSSELLPPPTSPQTTPMIPPPDTPPTIPPPTSPPTTPMIPPPDAPPTIPPPTSRHQPSRHRRVPRRRR